MQNSVRMPTAEEVLEWQANPVTQALHHLVRLWVEELRDDLEEGTATALTPHADQGLRRSAYIAGCLATCRRFTSVDHETFLGAAE